MKLKVPTRVIIHICCSFPLCAMYGIECRNVLPQTYGQHFTIWMWTLFLLTFGAALPAIVDPAYWVPFLLLFAWTFGTVFEVLTLLVTMVFRDPVVLLAHGRFGLVYFGDKLLHTLPVFAVLGFVIVHRPGLTRALKYIQASKWAPAAYLWMYLSPGLYVGLYSLTHDITKEYYSHMETWVGAIVVIVTILITQTVLLFVFLRKKNNILV